jgi:hypothetical protein
MFQNQTEENEIYKACSMYWGHGKYIKNPVRKPEGVSLGKHKCRWKDIIDIYLR